MRQFIFKKEIKTVCNASGNDSIFVTEKKSFLEDCAVW